jgi:hypothetical protein
MDGWMDKWIYQLQCFILSQVKIETAFLKMSFLNQNLTLFRICAKIISKLSQEM